MNKIIELPKAETLNEFIQENFDPSQMQGVKGIVAGLLMEDGKVDLVISEMNWKKVVWIATLITNFASQCGDE